MQPQLRSTKPEGEQCTQTKKQANTNTPAAPAAPPPPDERQGQLRTHTLRQGEESATDTYHCV